MAAEYLCLHTLKTESKFVERSRADRELAAMLLWTRRYCQAKAALLGVLSATFPRFLEAATRSQQNISTNRAFASDVACGSALSTLGQ
jgi:hypothetical protein